MIRLLCRLLWLVFRKRRHASFCVPSYVASLERSLTQVTHFAKFQPNDETLWAKVRHSLEDFLLMEWRSGALLGNSPEQAYFVRCDRTTMTQTDIDNGRLICVVGVAPLKPSEYVVIRIGQWTRVEPDP